MTIRGEDKASDYGKEITKRQPGPHLTETRLLFIRVM